MGDNWHESSIISPARWLSPWTGLAGSCLLCTQYVRWKVTTRCVEPRQEHQCTLYKIGALLWSAAKPKTEVHGCRELTCPRRSRGQKCAWASGWIVQWIGSTSLPNLFPANSESPCRVQLPPLQPLSLKDALLAKPSVLGQHLPARCALEIYSLFTHTALDPVALRVL